MTAPRILVAGVGNIFLGDDAFGCEVIRRLQLRVFPPEVRVVDFGIRSLDLTYALLDGYDSVILVDAVPRGEAPGTLYLIEADVKAPGLDVAPAALDLHGMEPAQVLRAVSAFGGIVKQLLIVGCEPSLQTAGDDEFPEMCPAVQAAIDEAAEMVERLVKEQLTRFESVSALEHP